MRRLADVLIQPVVRMALAEDLGRAGDVTAMACISEGARMKAAFAARKPGVLAGIDARIAIFSAVIWLMIAYTSRYSSAAELSAAIAAPFAGLLFLGPQFPVAVLVVIAAVLFWRHKANIARLRAGTEGRIGGNKSKDKQAEG